MDRLVSSLSLKVARRELHSKDARVRLSSVLSRWYPISSSVLRMIVEKLPSPQQAITHRLPLIWPNASPPQLVEAVAGCQSGPSVPLCLYVSQMVELTSKQLNVCSQPKFDRREYVRNKFKPKTETADTAASDASSLNLSSLYFTQESAARDTSTADEADASVKTPAENFEVHSKVGRVPEGNESADRFHFMAIARIFSGTLKSDSTLHVYRSVRSDNG
jgi:ribosome assembly protein 1